MIKLSVEQTLRKATFHIKNDEIVEAKKLYYAILQNFPKNLRAQEGLAKLKETKQNNNLQNSPEQIFHQLINHYKKNEFNIVFNEAKALTTKFPKMFIFWNILGASAQKLGKFDEAIDAYQKVILLKPDLAEVYSNMGVALKEQGKFDKAIEAHQEALSINPNYAEAYSNIGNTFKNQGKFDDAIEAYQKALSLKPDYACVFSNIGFTFQSKGKLDEAIENYKKSIALDPDFAGAHKDLGLSLLNTGQSIDSNRIKEGLDEYEWRWKTDNFLSSFRHFPRPLWDGQTSLTGKRILIWSEQGIGDTMNWSPCLSLVATQAQHVTLECQDKLVPLLSRSFPNIEVKAEDRSLDTKRDDFDLHLPMGSLYKHFIDDVLDNKKTEAYLVPDPDRVKYWKERLSSVGEGPYVGISWKSSVKSAYRLEHYPSISEWAPVLNVPNVTFINLQYVDYAEDIARVEDEFGVKIHNFDDIDQHGDIDEVAALCAALDVVVSTKVTPPMISAGVGTPTKIANWRQSIFNNILNNPNITSFEMIDRDTGQSWDNVFKSIAEKIST